MLLEKVRVHNPLNGFGFSAAEFGAIALVLAPIAVYYWAAGRWALALVTTGIIVNCLPIAGLALRSLRAREPSVGWRGLRDHAVRARLRSDPPRLLTDSVIITVCTLVPFLGAALVTADLFRHRRLPNRGDRHTVAPHTVATRRTGGSSGAVADRRSGRVNHSGVGTVAPESEGKPQS